MAVFENFKHQTIILFASIAIALAIATLGILSIDAWATTRVASVAVIMLAIAFMVEVGVPKKRQTSLMDTHLSELTGESRFQDIVEEAPDPILMLDSRGYLSFINKTAEAAFGYRRKELLGKHFAELGVFSANSLPKAMKEFTLLMSGNPSSNYSADFVRKDRSGFGAEVSHKPIIIGGKFEGIEIIVHYSEEKKKA